MAHSEGGSKAAARIDLAEVSEFKVGGMRVRPTERVVELNGKRHDLQPRVMQVLVALAEVRPTVVSRDRLLERCWAGRAVSDDAINRCILSLRQLANSNSPVPFTIQTVPRIGHRLIENAIERSDELPAAPSAPLKPRWPLLVTLLAGALVAVLVAALVWPRFAGPSEPIAIAVLPFVPLSGDRLLAEGMGDGLRAQLARDSRFRIAGSASSDQFRNPSDPEIVARLLKVTHLVHGSVRTLPNRVIVEVMLLQGRNGERLWSQHYDAPVQDLYTVHQQMAGAIAAALAPTPYRSLQASTAAVANGDAYNLYLTARGLLRTRSRRHGGAAVDLLQEAVRLDPGYAPAWASLAEAIQLDAGARGYQAMAAAIPLARDHARRATRLAPDLAEGHRVLARLLGFGDPIAQAHCRRAAELEPNNAESWLVLGVCHETAGEFERALAASRRAVELDPNWNFALGRYSELVAEMGERDKAEAIVRRGLARDQAARNIALARIALFFGDYAEAARLFSSKVVTTSPRWSAPARSFLNDAIFPVGLPLDRLEPIPRPPDKPRRWRVLMESAPAPSVWQDRNRDPIAALVYREDNLVAAKLMLIAGRERELEATYDSPVGLFDIRPGRPLRADQIDEAPIVALALRRRNRTPEADRLLEQADAAVRSVLRRGRPPLWFQADAAAVWAMQGRVDAALVTLEQVLRKGWAHSFGSDLRGLSEEPAFYLLRGQRRFKAVSAYLRASTAREREEIARQLTA
jgi:TolB-like protein/DNA-binding winged helix-turn-helix (wHTH) protein/cytochrome c-type biogenesis protein CcmH/NrfG